MKKPEKKIVFRSAPGGFADVLLQAEKLTERFRSTNLDFALREAVNDGRLFCMPAGKIFAYCRGTGPVGLGKVRLGRHEKDDGKGTPDWNSPRLLTATYRIHLVDTDSEEDRETSVDVAIPSRFTNFYVERSEGIAHNPSLTRLEFTYNATELKVWIRQRQMEIYADAENAVHEEIARLKERAEEIRKFKKPGRQVGF